MKKYLIIGLIGLVSVTACTNQESAKAGVPNGFVEVSKDEFKDTVRVIKHKETGCYYINTSGTQATSITQMFVEKKGVNVPYCE